MNNSKLASSFHQSQINNSQLKPFTFQLPQNEKFNILLLENIDLHQLEDQGFQIFFICSDLNTCSSLLRNFISAKITPETVNELDYDKFTKLIKVCQLSIDYYTQNQEQKELIIEEKLKDLSDKQENLSKLTEIEKRHKQQIDKIKVEMSDLKKEYQNLKATSLENVQFKCHLCEKVFKGRDYLTTHLQKKHQNNDNKGLNQLTNPEQLSQLLVQLQNQPIQNEPIQGQYQQSNGFGLTGQSWGIANPNQMRQQGLEELQRLQAEKQKKKEEKRQAREQKRQLQSTQKAQKRQDSQKLMMQGIQNNINDMMEAKMQEFKIISEAMVDQQLQIKSENQQIQSDLQQTLQNFKQHPLESKISQDQSMQSYKGDSFREETLTLDNNQSLDSFDMKLSKEPNKQSIKLIKSISPQRKNEQSELMSQHNYSYSQNQSPSPLRGKQSSSDSPGMNRKNKMAHIGELESDDDHDHDHDHDYDDYEDKEINKDTKYLKPLNKKIQMKIGEEEVLNAIFKKNNLNYNDKPIDEAPGFIDHQIKREKKRIGIPTDNMDQLDQKDIKQILKKLQDGSHK